MRQADGDRSGSTLSQWNVAAGSRFSILLAFLLEMFLKSLLPDILLGLLHHAVPAIYLFAAAAILDEMQNHPGYKLSVDVVTAICVQASSDQHALADTAREILELAVQRDGLPHCPCSTNKCQICSLESLFQNMLSTDFLLLISVPSDAILTGYRDILMYLKRD